MKNLLLCLVLAACTAALKTEFKWEKKARVEWKQYAHEVASSRADLAELLR